MPIVALDSHGKPRSLTLTNVRCVPAYAYTLLSVQQLWAEQRIEAAFADTNALLLRGKGEHGAKPVAIPYSAGERLPSVKLTCTAPTAAAAPPPAKSLPAALCAALSADAAAADKPAAPDAPPSHASSRTLGFRRVGASAHVAKLPASQAAELMHRRSHLGVAKLRATARTTVDVPKILASAPATTGNDSVADALARIKRAPHSGSLTAPDPEPGELHTDLKELIVAHGNLRYVAFFIDAYSRFVFVDYLKHKSEYGESTKRAIAEFNATVGVRVDSEGRPLPRPVVRVIQSDREGKLVSHYFKSFCAENTLHHTTSPPHDHDLNPIAERCIGLISEIAAAIRYASGVSARYWPWIIGYAVDWHNSAITSVGSSPADETITPYQRFTLRPPRVMDLMSFGARAVVLKPPTHQHKPSLSTRGWLGAFLGRSRHSKGAYDVLVGNKVVTSSSVAVDEEHFDLAPEGQRHRPLTAVAHATQPRQPVSLTPNLAPTGRDSARALTFLDMFSGPFSRSDGLSANLRARGWHNVIQIDNNGEWGGGWEHDLLNDKTFSKLMVDAHAGRFHGVHLAFPCSTGSVARHFDASTSTRDRGPPKVRDHDRPDGLPDSELDPKHVRELRRANLLLVRTVALAIACRFSPARTRISFENPADRSVVGSTAYLPELSDHGSILATTAFKRLIEVCELKSCTFAFCTMNGATVQKYTTIYYTPELAPVLDTLNEPEYQCSHGKGGHSGHVGGRDADGEFTSAAAAAYPAKLCDIIARAFTVGCCGDERVPDTSAIAVPRPQPRPAASAPPRDGATSFDGGVPSHVTLPTSAAGGVSPPSAAPNQPPPSPIAFPHLSPEPNARPTAASAAPPTAASAPTREVRSLMPSSAGTVDGHQPLLGPRRAGSRADAASRFQPSSPTRQAMLDAIAESPSPPPHAPASPDYTPGGTSTDAAEQYEPFDASTAEHTSAASVMEAAVHQSVLLAASRGQASTEVLLPISQWRNADARACPRRSRLPGGKRATPVLVAIADDSAPTDALLEELHVALRADSAGAPATHRQAEAAGEVWILAEKKELSNHANNKSWTLIPASEVPAGRRIHKLIWVYKLKRDGTAKARLCVQGNTLESGVDYDQVYSAALRYSSARALFAYAARRGCRVRSVDLVAAYLQGRFVDGERVYCHQAQGYVERGADGEPLIARVDKPIYGIQQAGRRLQRMLFAWLDEQGFVALDDSDHCVFVREHADGEILRVGLYVDNLQIVHSAVLDANGRGPAGCAYNAFMDALAKDWEVTDEGPMEDLLGIEVDYLDDGSIKLHQTNYITTVLKRFLPDGPLKGAGSLPYSADFMRNVADALALPPGAHPELVKPMQERIGCLMYAATSTRPDIAFAVHYLCKCMQRPTPALISETDHVLSYLARHTSAGLTYSPGEHRLDGYSDASWETAASTSGWVVRWQSAALTWGSRKQKSIALSTCEAEIIALSEAAKDVVYLRKLVRGLGAPENGPTSLKTDSQSARDVSYNPEHHDRMKHVQRRHFFIRDMVESFEIEVPFVRTNEQLADFLTKPMKSPKQFHALRKQIMNEP